MGDQAPNPFPSYVNGLLRTLGGVVGGYLIAKGYFTAEQTAQLGGAAIALAVAGSSLYQKYRAHKALKSAIAAPSGQA